MSTIRKDNFVVVHADIYNRRDEKQKVYEVRRLGLVQSIWTLSDISVNSGHRAERAAVRASV